MMPVLVRRPITAAASFTARTTLSRPCAKTTYSAHRQIHIARQSGGAARTQQWLPSSNLSRPTLLQPTKLQWRGPSDLRAFSFGGSAPSKKPGNELPNFADSTNVPAAAAYPQNTPPGAPTGGIPPPTQTVPSEPAPLTDNIAGQPLDLGLPDFSDSLPQISEQIRIGYLESLGLEYSLISPTHWAEWMLEHVAVYTGLPWLGSVAVTALLVRLLFLRSQMKMSDIAATSERRAPEMEAAKAKLEQFRKTQDHTLLQDPVVQELRGTMLKSFGTMMTMIFGQMYLGFGSFYLLKAMATLPVPGLETGGLAWFTDLTVPDPLYVLPATFGATIFLTMKYTMRPAREEKAAQIQKYLPVVLPGLSFVVSIFLPALVQCAFLVTSVVSGTISYLMNVRAVRARLGLGQFPVAAAAPAPRIPQLRMKDWNAPSPANRSIGMKSYQAPQRRNSRK
ncbi:hypothetical protein P152DRAFT_33719 [Eremomyces bilateralis CBS 781.70]|uniref:Mitochondrial export translocase Oxa1 n=1 Tax=Eremomyces bilateralis CBS 781.70 TaxID=1392243 RepID=A0A6G1G2N7_9PEZI|nr:uncharacterized protein P152DRAFT_33719 [Eremomyces bilateralis CBS 781.70]KAF1812377.1 hypothetical protein P152DRAFT_33719 [Eremomyces bilateralis CBS 781.70]